jgi:hypothetical protein
MYQLAMKDTSFKLRLEKKEALYLGGLKNDITNNIRKIGKSNNANKRGVQHSTATIELNRFVVESVYQTYPDLAIPTERYTHAILDPLMIKTNSNRREHFFTDKEFVDKIINKILNSQDELVEDVNSYIRNIKKL